MVVPRVLDWEGLQAGPSTNHQQVQEALEASREEQVVPAVLQAGPSKDQLREALVASRAVPVVLRAGPSTGLQMVLQALEA